MTGRAGSESSIFTKPHLYSPLYDYLDTGLAVAPRLSSDPREHYQHYRPSGCQHSLVLIDSTWHLPLHQDCGGGGSCNSGGGYLERAAPVIVVYASVLAVM